MEIVLVNPPRHYRKMKRRNNPLTAYTVYMSDGSYYTTSMAEWVKLKDARQYFLGSAKTFPHEKGEPYPVDVKEYDESKPLKGGPKMKSNPMKRRRNSPISRRDLSALRRIIKSHTKRKLAGYRASAKKGRAITRRRKHRGR